MGNGDPATIQYLAGPPWLTYTCGDLVRCIDDTAPLLLAQIADEGS